MALYLNDLKGIEIKSNVKLFEVLTAVLLKIVYCGMGHCVIDSAVSDVSEDCSAPL
jgi:hypothetical protein